MERGLRRAKVLVEVSAEIRGIVGVGRDAHPEVEQPLEIVRGHRVEHPELDGGQRDHCEGYPLGDEPLHLRGVVLVGGGLCRGTQDGQLLNARTRNVVWNVSLV
jgi:hypothetical protein